MTATTIDQVKPATRVTQTARIGIGLALSALSAALLVLAFQPYSVWPLAFFAFVPMLVAEHRVLPRQWAGLAAAIGIGGWLLVFLTSLFGLKPNTWFFPAIALLIGGINFFIAPGIRRFHERTRYRWFVLQGVFDWVALEMIRSFIPPINTHAFLAQTAYTQPWLLQPISIFSIYGLSLVIMLVNFALGLAALMLFDRKWRWDGMPAVERRSSLRWLATAGIVLVLWVGIGLITLASAPTDAPTVRVAAIQHGFLKPGHVDPDTQEERLQMLTEQTRAAARQGAKLMVWPELGLGFDPQVEHTAELRALAAETGAYLLIGYGITTDPRGWRNEAVMLTPSGDFLEVYGKDHNTVPGEDPIVTAGTYPIYNTSLGQLGTIICEDVNHTDTSRIVASKGAQLITIPTYETAVQGFHWEMPIQGVLRAVENRVATVKADTAWSAMIVDPYGRILARRDGAPQGEAFALVADVPLGTGNTPYSQLGDWVGWLSLAGFIFFTVFMQVEKRARKR